MPQSPRHSRSTHLLISAMGEQQPGLLDHLTRAILDSGCSIQDSHMAVLGNAFTATLLVSGNWNTLSKLDGALVSLARQQGLDVHTRRTGPGQREGHSLPYSVDVIALDQPGIVHQLVGFFSSRGVTIREMNSQAYTAAHSSTPMFTAHLSVEIPATEHIASLREDFLDLCDELNLDGVIEPIKG
ncbi:MAG: glycine cleavage system protein R [Pseudomonadota bacterium]|uniref:glycine cleavage system protein R n=1 Tax=unclassified Ectothiorhodospira TaxID=2684909 RepID=UPI001EE79F11|nr:MULTISPECIES: ACT domain-containing protein [unclassified Ectothiorhodospira]MCG5516305.1 glycine cleavage system protein R [Ectothiorhodospira sp. 9100]MCG5519316.1 glycine cleavage system protein R [Ectothiorhodospira sp. 9905]